MTPEKQLQTIADQIINRLLTYGIVIHRYNAYSTNSIYLKFDYGVANSLRISDHTGKQHLAYRFNLMLNTITKQIETRNNYPVYCYPPTMINELIDDIISHRQQKQNKYGLNGYKKTVEKVKEIERRTNQCGFWRSAKEIKSHT